MKKTFIGILICFLASGALAQKETFDIATYTPPKEFKKELKQGILSYSQINSTSGEFCAIIMYASSVSTGDDQKDFKREWAALVATPYNVSSNPSTQTMTTTDGWKAVVGVAPVKIDGIDLYMMLYVFSGFGKTFTVKISTNQPSYAAQIDALFATMELNKATKPQPAPGNASTTKPAGANGTTFGAMKYNAPAGWSHQKFQDGVVFKPLDLTQGEQLAMQIMQPLNGSGSLEQALKQSYDEAAQMYNSTMMNEVNGGNYQITEAKRSFNGWEYIRGKGGIQIENGTPYKSEFGLEMFVIKINGRFERVAVIKSRNNCGMSRYYPSEHIQRGLAIEDFLFSLQFTDAPPPAVKQGIAKGPGILGVWQGISLSVGAPQNKNDLGVGYKVFTPIFFSNGQAYFGSRFPGEGLNEFNSYLAAELNRRDWGTYTFSNGSGILKMPYGDIPLRMEGDKLVITPNKTDHRFFKMTPPDGAIFNGTYALSELNGKIPSITFTAGNKFTDNGAVKVLYHEYVDCINPALKPSSGTYEVKDHTVIFNYSDGRKIKIAFIGTDYNSNNQNAASLWMSSNQDELRRQ